jgi:hypothetical protein
MPYGCYLLFAVAFCSRHCSLAENAKVKNLMRRESRRVIVHEHALADQQSSPHKAISTNAISEEGAGLVGDELVNKLMRRAETRVQAYSKMPAGDNCLTGQMITDAATCATAATEVGRTFKSSNTNNARRPAGCYWEGDGTNSYFNQDLAGNPAGFTWCGGICTTATTTTTTTFAGISYDEFHCASRAECVDRLNLNVGQFIRFQCKCIDEHYKDYLHTGGQWPSETTQMCIDFIECLQGEHSIAERLVVNMARAIGRDIMNAHGNGLVEEKALKVNAQVATTSTCFEPSNATYAALVECECLDDLIAVCGAALVEDTVACLFEHACGHSKVCGDWKASHCPYSALQMQYSSDVQERNLLQQLFPKTNKDERLWQGQGIKLPQFERDVSHWGLNVTPEQVKSLWDDLETDLLGNQSHVLLNFEETKRSPLSNRNLKRNGDLNDDMSSRNLDATVLGKCTGD